MRPLAEMLAVADALAAGAGVSRLAELTQLDRLGFPVFQAVRPRSRSLATAMGRGATRRAAIVSALLEAVETDVAERLEPAWVAPLATLGPAAHALWAGDARDPLAVRLDPAVSRGWLHGTDLAEGTRWPVPFDLLSQDLTRPAMPDTLASTVGLASGGSREEALAAAVAELLEHDLDADWRRATPAERRGCELDLATVSDAAVGAALARIGRAGCGVHLWSLGQPCGIAAMLCLLTDGRGAATHLPPVAGSGCHPDRAVAALRAMSEAAQARCALIAGARDDIVPAFYADPRAVATDWLLSCLCFGAGPLAWDAVPTLPRPGTRRGLRALLAAARVRADLPLIAVTLPSPHPFLHIVKVAAPGLRLSERSPQGRPVTPAPTRALARPRTGQRLLFVGPTLWNVATPAGIARRPPAVAGDLAALLADPPERVGLVDGRFETAPSVWHKELMELIAAGTVVYGAASLGALRAAELGGEGMVGVGRVYEGFRDGRVRRDDAVMVAHAPAELGYRPLTVALVDAEAAIARAATDPFERRMLQRIARTMPFRERTWRAMLAAFGKRTGRPCGVGEAVLAAIPSLKQQDALQLVARMLAPLPDIVRPARPPLTSHHRRLLARV